MSKQFFVNNGQYFEKVRLTYKTYLTDRQKQIFRNKPLKAYIPEPIKLKSFSLNPRQ